MRLQMRERERYIQQRVGPILGTIELNCVCRIDSYVKGTIYTLLRGNE
jgi:hypothetical protein